MAKQDKRMIRWHDYQRDRAMCVCEVCGYQYEPEMLCGHHIISKGSHPEYKYMKENGLTVCNVQGCHNWIHANQDEMWQFTQFSDRTEALEYFREHGEKVE